MGLDLGRPVLRAARALVAGGLLVAALATPAVAADPTPAPSPAASPVSTLPPPSQQQIDDAKNALNRLRRPARAPATPTTTIAQVAGPVAPRPGSVASRISDEAWWTLGAALLVLLVLSETTRISVRRAKHRKEA
jgi:hypothetical protein